MGTRKLDKTWGGKPNILGMISVLLSGKEPGELVRAEATRVALMSASHPTIPNYAAFLALSVRDLAQDAHRTLTDPASDVAMATDLLRRISHLEEHVCHDPGNPVALWLHSLKGQVQQAHLARSHEEPSRGSRPSPRAALAR